MACTFFVKEIVHVFKIFIVTTLVACHGDRLGIFLDGGVHHFLYTPVVTQMDYFAAGGLNDATHDVDGRVMPVKQTGGGDNAYFINRNIGLRSLVSGEILLFGFLR